MYPVKKLFAILMVSTFALSSCSKDDPKPTIVLSPIEGKWQFTKDGVLDNNQEVYTDYEHTPGCTKDYTEILAGNVIKDHYFEGPLCQESVDTGTWNRSNNMLVLVYPGGDTINAEIVALTATTLKVKFVVEGETNFEIFTRIP